jgi:hypothetical protein
MHVEIVEGHDPRAGTPNAALLALPRNYPVGWAIAWTLLLLTLCLAPERVLPGENTFSIKRYIPWSDLVVHFTLFTGFAWSWVRTTSARLRWAAVTAAGLALAVGTELAQGLSFIHRDPNIFDALADCTGVAAGLAAAALAGQGPRPQPTG